MQVWWPCTSLLSCLSRTLVRRSKVTPSLCVKPLKMGSLKVLKRIGIIWSQFLSISENSISEWWKTVQKLCYASHTLPLTKILVFDLKSAFHHPILSYFFNLMHSIVFLTTNCWDISSTVFKLLGSFMLIDMFTFASIEQWIFMRRESQKWCDRDGGGREIFVCFMWQGFLFQKDSVRKDFAQEDLVWKDFCAKLLLRKRIFSHRDFVRKFCKRIYFGGQLLTIHTVSAPGNIEIHTKDGSMKYSVVWYKAASSPVCDV